MTFLINLINHLPEWKAETIKEENLQDALEVLNTNIAGYYADTQEELPTLENLRQDIQALPPGCYEANHAGLAFWKAMGFAEIGRQGRKGRDGVERQLLSMEKIL